MNELKISPLKSFQGSEEGEGNKDCDNHNVLKGFLPFHLEFLISAGMTCVCLTVQDGHACDTEEVDCNNMTPTRTPSAWLILMFKSRLIFTLLKSSKNQPTAC